MKEIYLLDDLIIGRLYVCNNLGIVNGPINMITNEQYIFEIKKDDIVEEIITGDTFRKSRKQYQVSNLEKDSNNHIFNKRYVIQTESLRNILSEEFVDDLGLDMECINNGTINKWDLVKIYNKLNFKQNDKKKMLQKKITFVIIIIEVSIWE